MLTMSISGTSVQMMSVSTIASAPRLLAYTTRPKRRTACPSSSRIAAALDSSSSVRTWPMVRGRYCIGENEVTERTFSSVGLRRGYEWPGGSKSMKLHQLRYLAAVAQNGLNITAAAQKLHTSQPGVSKQIKLLEDELGFQIFVREGRNLTRITPAGQQVIDRAMRILQEASAIRGLSTELRDEGRGSLSIGTTHTQARYVLPDVIREFRGRYPNVRLNLHQGTSEQIAEMVAQDRIDCAIATGSEHLFTELTLLPCYRWHRTVIVPKGHPLADGARLTFRALAAYPLITYTFSFTGPSSLHQAVARAGP